MEYETVKEFIDSSLQTYRSHVEVAHEEHDYEWAFKMSLYAEALEDLIATMPDYLLWFSHK